MGKTLLNPLATEVWLYPAKIKYSYRATGA